MKKQICHKTKLNIEYINEKKPFSFPILYLDTKKYNRPNLKFWKNNKNLGANSV